MLPAAGQEQKESPFREVRGETLRSHWVGSQWPKEEPARGSRLGYRPGQSALLLSRLLTLGCVPIQASSGAHGWALPPPRSSPGSTSPQPAVGWDSPRSSMPGRAARPWCTTPCSPRPARSWDSRVWVPPPRRVLRRRGRAQVLGESAPPSDQHNFNLSGRPPVSVRAYSDLGGC